VANRRAKWAIISVDSHAQTLRQRRIWGSRSTTGTCNTRPGIDLETVRYNSTTQHFDSSRTREGARESGLTGLRIIWSSLRRKVTLKSGSHIRIVALSIWHRLPVRRIICKRWQHVWPTSESRVEHTVWWGRRRMSPVQRSTFKLKIHPSIARELAEGCRT